MLDLSRVFDAPWKIWNELWRWIAYPRVRLLFAMNGIAWGNGWRIHGVPIIQKHRRSQMSFGPGLGLRSSVRSNPLGPNHPVVLSTWQAGATLQIGANFAMTGGTICAAEEIIKNNVIVSEHDHYRHRLSSPNPEQRIVKPSDGKTCRIVIEDDVFVGMNCLVLKGVTIGQAVSLELAVWSQGCRRGSLWQETQRKFCASYHPGKTNSGIGGTSLDAQLDWFKKQGHRVIS
jgi:hypothetical protein